MGGKTSKSTQTVSIPPEVLARYNAVNARAEAAANTPFKQYGGEFVAGLTGSQRQGMSNINAAANMAQPYYGAAGSAFNAGLNQGQGYLGEATQYARAGGYNVDPSKLDAGAIGEYISPYLGNVLQGVAALQNQQNQQAMSGQLGNAVRSGAFGGDRVGIQAANLNQQQRIADANIYGNILNTAYNNAVNTAAGQQSLFLGANQANRTAQQQTADRIAGLGQQGFNQYTSTGQNVQGLGTAAQNAAILGGKAQMDAGAVEQATKQAEDTALYNQFKEEQSYPFQVGQYLANIAEGTGALSGSTTTTAQPGGFFSDARLKENIEKVGKTYDGQHIYRYNYKGDPTTQIGLIAQEVERHHPDAVGSAGHYRTVDYDKATDHAADRGHFYAGGLASMGGSVDPMQAGQGFAEGGLAGYDPAYMAELYRQLYAAGTGHGINGMQGIPVTPSEIHELMVAKGLQGDSTNKVTQAVDAIDSVGRLGNTLGAWHYGEKESPRRHPMDERTGHAFGGDIEDPEAKKQVEEAGLAKAALEASKPEPQAGGLAAPAPAPTTPVKIEAPKADLKFGDTAPTHKLAVANAPVKPTNHGSQTIDDFGKLVDIGAKIAGGMNQGGRIYRDLGGGMPYSNDQSIVPQQDAQQHQLMTAQGIGSGGGGAGKAIGSIAGLASSLIPGGGIVKKGLGAIGKLFSDERMKENIRPIGELFDGQKVHSFNYKGDPRTQIGLIAQEVEHHSPHAVDHDHGMKTVDYHDATQHAAHRGHFAQGGMPDKRISEIFASLRKEVDPRSNLSNLASEQDMELRRNLHPDNAPEERLGGLQPMPPAVFPKGAEKPVMGLGKTEGLAKAANNFFGPVPKGLDSEVVEFFRNKGLSEDQARGIAAGIVAESGGNRMAVNPTSGAMGLGQWLGPRKRAVVAKYGENPSKDEQLEHLWSELTGGDRGGSKVLEKEDAHSVLNSYINDFMRPAKGHETESDISRGRKALGYASGGLAGRHGYAGDGFVPVPESASDEYARTHNPDGTLKATEANIPAIQNTGSNLTATAPTALGSAAMDQYKNQSLVSEQPQAVEKKPGLAQRVFGYDKSKPYDREHDQNFFHRLGHGETDAVLSALKGIAAMGAAPTRSLGVALATGLGAGVDAYQGQREFGRQLRETSAVEANVKAAQDRAAADVATAQLNLAALPSKIAGWRRLAQKGGPTAALATETANALQARLDSAAKGLNSESPGGLKTAIPTTQNGATPVASAASTETPDGGLAPKSDATAKGPQPGSAGDVFSDQDLYSIAGLTMPGTQNIAEMAKQGLLIDTETGAVKYDPSYVTANIASKAPQQRAGLNVSNDVEVGRAAFDKANDNWQTYKAIEPVLNTLQNLPKDVPPTTDILSKISNALAQISGLSEDQIAEKYGPQTNVNSVLAAAQAQGIPVKPSMGTAGVNAIIKDLTIKKNIADVSRRAAADYLKAKGGFDSGMPAYIEAALRVNRKRIYGE